MLMKYTIDKYIIRVLYDRLLQNRKNDFDIPIVKSTKMNLFFRNSKINKFRFCLLVPHWEYFAAQCGLE